MFYWIINLYGYSNCYSCINHVNQENDLNDQQLLSLLENTVNPSKEFLNDLLRLAFEKKYENIIRYILLKTRFNIRYQDKSGNSWLHYAVLTNNLKLIKILLHKGVDPNIQNKFGNTALHENAIHNPNPAVIRLLIIHGLKPKIENYENETALDCYLNNFPNSNMNIIRALKKRCMCYYL